MRILTNLWNDEQGIIDVTSMVLITTMLVIGMVVGFAAVRTNIVQEFGDVAQALDRVDQSYSYTVNGVTSQYADTVDVPAAQTAGDEPAGLDVQVAPSVNGE